ISRFRRTVSATPTHSWILSDGQKTDSLSVGHFVPGMRAQPKRKCESYRLGVLHGLVFGDGTWSRQAVRSGDHRHYVDLYGDRTAKFREFFDKVNFHASRSLHPSYHGTGVVDAGCNLKRVLPET